MVTPSSTLSLSDKLLLEESHHKKAVGMPKTVHTPLGYLLIAVSEVIYVQKPATNRKQRPFLRYHHTYQTSIATSFHTTLIN
jgi:hypothetical protein